MSGSDALFIIIYVPCEEEAFPFPLLLLDVPRIGGTESVDRTRK